MDKIVLGLLMIKGRTIYEIKSKIEQGMNMMYSSSTGSIQAALKKLLALGFIEYNEIVEKGKYKKIYSITLKGVDSFNEWVNSPILANQAKNSELTKLFFMGLSDKEKREERIEKYIVSLEEIHDALKLICAEGNLMNVPNEQKELFNYQYLSAKYGVDTLAFEIKWYRKLLNNIKDGIV